MCRRLSLAAVAVAGTTTLLAGCGSGSSGGSGGGSNNSSVAPKTELVDALHSLSAGNALTTTLGLQTTAANIEDLANNAKHPTRLTPQQAALIASARINIEAVAPAGKTLAQAQTPAVASTETIKVTGTAGGTTYFSFTDVDKTLYLQVNLKGILDAAGQDGAYQGIVAQASSFPAFAQDFIAGKPVSVTFAALANLESVIKAGLQQQGGADPIPDTSTLLGLTGKLQTALLADLTVTRPTSGSTDQLEVSGNLRTIDEDLLNTLGQAIPAAANEIDPSQADQVPDKDVKLDAYVTNGALSKLAFDITQFAPAPKNARQRKVIADAPSIVAGFAKSGPAIVAPTGATPVAFSDLVQLFTTIGQQSS